MTRSVGKAMLTYGLAALVSCNGSDSESETSFGTGDTGPDSTSTDPTTTSGSESAESSGTTSDPPVLDVGVGETETGGIELCKVPDDELDGLPPCRMQVPPDSFLPDIQWTWEGSGDFIYAVAIPLVANLTDDNDDNAVDLCDDPDVVVLAYSAVTPGLGHLFILDGETGTEHTEFQTDLHSTLTPAIGDLDNDGVPDIVAVSPALELLAFDAQGNQMWQGDTQLTLTKWASLSIADIDNDGNPEIVAGSTIFNNVGQWQWTASESGGYAATTTTADIDNDNDLELILGHAAFQTDGSAMWSTGLETGFPQVGNLDADPEPEILLTNVDGLSLLNHDGSIIYQNLTPTGDPTGGLHWLRPATIHNFDADPAAEFASASTDHYTVYDADATIVWSSDISDMSGGAGGTAFDFLSDGDAEAMYADENDLFIFDDAGGVLLNAPRTSYTGSEFPVVADIDNDGSAEILVVSNINQQMNDDGPTLQAIRDQQDRWVQARRIWNQHTYHVTNVREDGTIPQVEPHHWELLNTFRTNAAIEGDAVCDPAG